MIIVSLILQSTWNQYFCDKELRVVIEQDVTRTFPGVDFFRDKDIQNSMVNILFCYAREFPKMCYRQVRLNYLLLMLLKMVFM